MNRIFRSPDTPLLTHDKISFWGALTLRKSNALCIMNGDKDQRTFSRSFSVHLHVHLHVTSAFAFFFDPCSPVLEIANIECEHVATDLILDF